MHNEINIHLNVFELKKWTWLKILNIHVIFKKWKVGSAPLFFPPASTHAPLFLQSQPDFILPLFHKHVTFKCSELLCEKKP